jgi:hypothetical protein
MKNRINRTLFWFSNHNERLYDLGDDFFGISTLLNRLLNKVYEGKKIKFINIYFATKEKYANFPVIPLNHVHHHGGHIAYHGLIDFLEFNKLDKTEQKKFIWKKACHYLQVCAKSIKNDSLLKAVEYAYSKGLEENLDPDYRMVEKDIHLYGQEMKASVWVNFKNDGMYSKFTLEKDNQIVFEKDIDNTKNGIEIFLELYKGIEFENNTIIIKGRGDVDYLPLKIVVNEKLEEIK